MSKQFESTQGKALLASPYLEDPNFSRSVVYMVRHDPQEAFGLILNRPTEHSIVGVFEKAANATLSRDGWLHYGGPVEGPLIALHDQQDLADMACSQGIYLTTERDHLMPLMMRTDARIKLFAGFSGWGPGQLESERATGGWFVSDITLEQALEDSDNLWKELLYRVGHLMWSETGFDLGESYQARWN
ncbi:MAG: YqgE/AlgH family protein [Pirellula sp.]|jgi:putative transcriptional regulator|nr:YqgE/AlgH family protein [Pirellula sp.]